MRRQVLGALFAAGTFALALSCSNGPKPCVPGQSIACTGPAGCKGGQICAADGESFGPCDCGQGFGGGSAFGGGVGFGGGDFAGGGGGAAFGGGDFAGGGGAGGGGACPGNSCPECPPTCNPNDTFCESDGGSFFCAGVTSCGFVWVELAGSCVPDGGDAGP